MKVAVSYDWLLSRRGGGRVLREFCVWLEHLSIFTLFFDFERVDSVVKKHSIYASKLNRLPRVRNYYRYLLPWFPAGIESCRVKGQELLLSLSHAVAKGIPHDPEIPHVCYCFTPMRYVWATELYQSALEGSWQGKFLGHFKEPLKDWDLKANQGIDHFVAISRTVQERIKSHYGRESTVIHPCVDLSLFQPSDCDREDFHLMVSALVPQKRLELAVEAFNRNRKPLMIVGTGPLKRRLARQAESNIQFLGWLPDDQVRELYCRARALVFPGLDEFGLVPVEAQACGCPVIALGRGGVTETVREGETGVFFENPTVEGVLEGIERFEKTDLDHQEILSQARQFSQERFRSEWRSFFKRVGLQVP